MCHADTQTNRRKNRYKNSNIPFASCCHTFKIHEFSRETAEKCPNLFCISGALRKVGRTDTEAAGYYEIKYRISQFWYVIKMRCTSTETCVIYDLPTDRQADVTYTYTPLADTPALHSDSHELTLHVELQPFRTSFGHSLVSFIVASLQFPSLNFKFITSYRTHRVLMNTVYIK